MKILKTIYYILIAFLVLIVLLLVVSVFPISGNIKFMVVQSGSMAPDIKMGSVVMVKPAENYNIGDVISFGKMTKTEWPTTHRIYDIKVVGNEALYITKGDTNNAPDPKQVSHGDIIGKVLFDIPYLGYAVNFAKKPIGFALIIIVPAAVIIGDEIKKIFREVKKKNV